MNSSEQKSFENISPTEDEIEETIQLLNDILELPQIELLKNVAAKQGYDLAVDILVEDIRDIKAVDWYGIKTTQARAIGVLAIDYLNGECSREVLLGVPIKE